MAAKATKQQEEQTPEIIEEVIAEESMAATEAGLASEFGDAVKGEREDRGRGRGPRGERKRRDREEEEFDTRIISVRRVSRMHKGGRRMRLSVFVVIGDKKGFVGAGLGKGADVAEARRKAISRAKKNLVSVTLKGNTIPHEVRNKHKASRILIKPAAPGTGIVAGATVKAVLELAGVQDALTKVLESNNPINVTYATIEGLHSLRTTRL